MGSQKSINLITHRELLILNGKADFGELILNVLIFVPFGLCVGILFKKWNFAKNDALFSFISFLFGRIPGYLGNWSF